VAGGGRPDGDGLRDGYFCEPTVLAGVTNDMTVAREEIFGPVQSVLRFSDEDEALAKANDSAYGLSAAVFTRDFSRAHRMARLLQVGQVHINDYPLDSVETPFGGYKDSGIGREKGLQALAGYTQLKTVLARVPPAHR
jgi:aldehyde dehydrogenase (NAD+)